MRHRPKPHARPGATTANAGQWLYGLHPVTLALRNPKRQITRLLWAGDGELAEDLATAAFDKKIRIDRVDKKHIEAEVGAHALHQNIAAQVRPLPDMAVEDVIAMADGMERATVVILDQVTDPHNVGAIMRSAAAFGALAVIVQDKNSPPVTGTLAKAASGAVDLIPLVRATNLTRAMEQLKAANFWCLGLDANGAKPLNDCGLTGGKVALIMGSEGDGMRRLVAEHCDLLVRLPINRMIDSLNVSNAAAIALYELNRNHGS